MRTSNIIAPLCLLLCVCALTCEGGYKRKRSSGCYISRRQCEAKCCCSGKRCEPTTVRGRTYYKCVTVDCGKLNDPANGKVTTIGGTTFESLASYSCNDGYILSYPVGRTCLSTSQWSGEEPRCEPEPVCGKQDCPTLEPPCNGFFIDPQLNPKPGDVLTYGCHEGFEVDGETTRICQDNYTWEGTTPCCVKTCRQMTEYGDQLGGSKYRIFSDDAMNWTDARSICEVDSAHLVEIDSATEQTHIEIILPPGVANYWTNANDISHEGIWNWPISGENIYGGATQLYTNWAPGEPSTAGCMRIYLLYLWVATDCNTERDFVCECPLIESVPGEE